jgi:hypothetical protein
MSRGRWRDEAKIEPYCWARAAAGAGTPLRVPRDRITKMSVKHFSPPRISAGETRQTRQLGGKSSNWNHIAALDKIDKLSPLTRPVFCAPELLRWVAPLKERTMRNTKLPSPRRTRSKLHETIEELRARKAPCPGRRRIPVSERTRRPAGATRPTSRPGGNDHRRRAVKLSAEIKSAMIEANAAQKVIDNLDRLRNEEVLAWTGIARARLGVLLWQAPMSRVAAHTKIPTRKLKRICKLYSIPTPAQGYWSTRPDRRTFRITAA